ncbi:MAG TPA: hypothetical protein VFV34_02165 [Blastocatellia bacterium]|nr:hypothetical protein [Blastocatellia bacterium]
MLAVRLTFRNHGSRALIIQKNMLGDVPYCRAADTVQELESAFWQHLLILRADSGEVTDIDGYPDERFIVLKPGATYRGRSFVRVVHTKPFVGETYLQVRIPTWSGTDAQAEKAARKWEKTGVLWTRAVRSGPFAVTISKDQKLKKCS